MPNYDKLLSRAQRFIAEQDYPAALQDLEKCVSSKQHSLTSYRMMANVYAMSGDYLNAESCYMKALSISPDDPQLNLLAARVMVYAGRPIEAPMELYNKALALKPDLVDALHGLGSLYRSIGQLEQAKSFFQRGIQIDGDHIYCRMELGSILRFEGKYQDAIEHFERCATLQPDNADALAGRAIMHFYMGDRELARDEIVSCAERFSQHPVVALAYTEICKRGVHAESAMQYIRDTLSSETIPHEQKSELHFTAAALADKLESYDEAFQHVLDANRRVASTVDRGMFKQRLQAAYANVTATVHSVDTSNISRGITPVFILGMPRSGSTLIEQVLSCHPEVKAGGELPHLYQLLMQTLQVSESSSVATLDDDALRSIATRYYDALVDISDGGRYVTDKLPGNFERIGLINAIFPDARIIHTVRDRRDTCISCLFQNFGNQLPYTSDMELLIEMYRYTDSVMQHWKTSSEIEIRDFSYEDLIMDAENEIRRLLEYVGLSWDTACLTPHLSDHVAKTASFDQVRQPLYSRSIGRWQHYRSHIADLLDAFSEPDDA